MKRQPDTRQFFYQNGKLTTVNQGGQQHTIFRTGEVSLAERDTDLAASATLLSTNESGSVLSGNSAAETARLLYAAYGYDAAKASMLSLLRFNGQYRTSEGHYLLGNGYRSYSPVLMRFYSPDSLSPFQEGGLNSYCYCLGDPVNQTDPTGHFSLRRPRTWFSTRKGRIKRAHNKATQADESLKTYIPNLLKQPKQSRDVDTNLLKKSLKHQINKNKQSLNQSNEYLKKHNQVTVESEELKNNWANYEEYVRQETKINDALYTPPKHKKEKMDIFNTRPDRLNPDDFYRIEEQKTAQTLETRNKHTRQA